MKKLLKSYLGYNIRIRGLNPKIYLYTRKIGPSSESQTDQTQENYILLEFKATMF
jgi:hypothetical protein